MYKVNGRLAASIPNIIISSVKNYYSANEDDLVEKPPVAIVVKA